MAVRIGVVEESSPGEKRVASTPESVRKLVGLGFEVVVERGAGAGSQISDQRFEEAGAAVVDGDQAWASDVVLKVRTPSEAELGQMRAGALLVAPCQAERHPGRLEVAAAKGISWLALEKIPRVTRAQKMDILSSQANLSGYRAVVEAAHHLQSPFGALVTAAGSTPPMKVLVIGCGVAGLAASAAAKAMGAEVRAFDTRAAAREQVESLGAKFLTISMEESGDGGGGYGKAMSEAFIEAEWSLFAEQAKDVEVIITTALVPGTKAPLLVPRRVVEALRPGSVIIDLAAEQGGNCELTVPGEVVVHQGVRIVGFTDLTSRMASVSSRFFAMNLVHLLTEMGGGEKFKIDLENDVVRPAVVLHDGVALPPAPRPAAPPAPAPKPPPADAKPAQVDLTAPNRTAWGTTLGGMVVIALLFGVGRFAPGDFLQHFTVFVLACFVGWQVIWSVNPALHTPLMSVTNAISGIIVVGGILQVRTGLDAPSILGAAAVLVATVNIVGGFMVTERMLAMFQRKPEVSR